MMMMTIKTSERMESRRKGCCSYAMMTLSPNDKDNSSSSKKKGATRDSSSSSSRNKGAPAWNAYRFEIRHASTRDNATMPTTRTFCPPLILSLAQDRGSSQNSFP
jgi:hypothetical protein